MEGYADLGLAGLACETTRQSSPIAIDILVRQSLDAEHSALAASSCHAGYLKAPDRIFQQPV